MTLEEIRELVVSVDPEAAHYESARCGSAAYTVWREIRLLDLMAEDVHQEGWSFQIDYYTKQENDPMAQAFRNTLDDDPRVAYAYLPDYEQDSGYIHHIFDCEGY